MSYDALRRGRYSMRHQIYSITTITRDRCPIFTDITPVRLLVRELRKHITTAPSERMRIFAQLPDISLPIHCERVWFRILAITPIGIASG